MALVLRQGYYLCFSIGGDGFQTPCWEKGARIPAEKKSAGYDRRVTISLDTWVSVCFLTQTQVHNMLCFKNYK